MHLFAAIVPPRDVLEELRAVVAGVAPVEGTVASLDAKPPKSHRKESAPKFRLLRRREPAAPEPAAHNQLDLTPLDQLTIPVTQFGNLTTADSVRLAEALRREARSWRRPTIHIAGGSALEWPGDLGVWARVDGDVEALQAIGRGVPPIAQRLSLFVDRRMFRTWLQVGTITDSTSAPYLEELVAALDRFTGRTWVQESITLFRGQPLDDEDSEPVEEMPLAPN